MLTARARRVGVALTVVGLLSAACGQKGAPLAPLRLVPAPVAELSVRRVGDRARLRFVLPARNENGPGPVELERVDIYAMTVAPSAPAPSAGELLSNTFLVGTIQVRPVPLEGEAIAEGDTRPQPGAAVSFDEELTGAALIPVPRAPAAVAAATPAEQPVTTTATTTAPAAAPTPEVPATAVPPPSVTPGPPAPGAAAASPAAPSAAVAAPPTDPRRIYVVRGVTRRGRPGAASPQAALPLAPLPAAPSDVRTRVTETGVVVEWTPPPETVAGYNVYAGAAETPPINAAPVATATFEHAGATFGEEQCYRVRSVTASGAASIEGHMSPPHCVTPRDQFPPAAPKGLSAVPTAGQINLIWDANVEKDLAGYVVLRGDAPDGPLQPLTATPIKETSYRDSTVKPGMRYIYVVVAVDAAAPPNTSAQSTRVEETAR